MREMTRENRNRNGKNKKTDKEIRNKLIQNSGMMSKTKLIACKKDSQNEKQVHRYRVIII